MENDHLLSDQKGPGGEEQVKGPHQPPKRPWQPAEITELDYEWTESGGSGHFDAGGYS